MREKFIKGLKIFLSGCFIGFAYAFMALATGYLFGIGFFAALETWR